MSLPIDQEVELRLGSNPKEIEMLRNNLKARALFVQTSTPVPVQSRVRVKIVSSTSETAELTGEVVFISPQGIGVQVLELSPVNQAKLDHLLGPAPAAPPPPPVAPPQAATAPHPVPGRLTIPLTGTLASDLPVIITEMHHKGAGDGKEVDPPLDTSFGLLLRLAQDHFTGCLTVETDQKMTVEVFFRDGLVVGGTSEPEDEVTSLGYALRKAGKLPESDYRDIQRKHKETKESEVKLLQKIVDSAALQKGWRVVIFQCAGKILAAKKSKYRIEEGVHHLSRTMPLPVHLHRVLYRSIMEAGASYSNEELYAGLDPFLNLYVSKKDELPFDWQKLKLDEKELRFLNVSLLVPTRLRTIFSVSALSRSMTLRALYALFFLRCLKFQTSYQPPEKEFLPHLNRVWSEISHATHFNVIQVHWTLIGPAIEAGYKRTKKEWEEIRQLYHNKPDYLPLIDKILGRIEESFRFLSDNDRRRQYRDEIIEPPMRAFSAELLSQHTRTYLLRGDKKAAKAYIEMACDIAPGNAEYRQLLRDSGG
ncbi:MAG: hypothetical protein V1495_03435 [Pseudomonadota bacterium]